MVAPHQPPKDLVKTDRLDAAKLATLLASGLLEGVWVPDLQQRLDRSLVRRRAQAVKSRRAISRGTLYFRARGHLLAVEPGR